MSQRKGVDITLVAVLVFSSPSMDHPAPITEELEATTGIGLELEPGGLDVALGPEVEPIGEQ